LQGALSSILAICSFLLGSNIFLSTLFLNILNDCSYRRGERFSCLHKTTYRITVSYILKSTILSRTRENKRFVTGIPRI
jgi:hypothetical protein